MGVVQNLFLLAVLMYIQTSTLKFSTPTRGDTFSSFQTADRQQRWVLSPLINGLFDTTESGHHTVLTPSSLRFVTIRRSRESLKIEQKKRRKRWTGLNAEALRGKPLQAWYLFFFLLFLGFYHLTAYERDLRTHRQAGRLFCVIITQPIKVNENTAYDVRRDPFVTTRCSPAEGWRKPLLST